MAQEEAMGRKGVAEISVWTAGTGKRSNSGGP